MLLQWRALPPDSPGSVFRQTLTNLTQSAVEPQALALDRIDYAARRAPAQDIDISKRIGASEPCEAHFSRRLPPQVGESVLHFPGEFMPVPVRSPSDENDHLGTVEEGFGTSADFSHRQIAQSIGEYGGSKHDGRVIPTGQLDERSP